jgi:formate dehydrogenase subunit gamma
MGTSRHAVLRHGPYAHEIERYTPAERIAHWVTAGTYVYCMMTGLGFFTPYLYWLVAIVGGGATARFWHPIVGIGFVAANFYLHHQWRQDLHMIPEDRVWMDKVKYYITNEDDLLPPQGRFDAGQKIFYWVMLYGAIVLLLSGIVMWFPEGISRSWHWVLPIVVIIHEAAALITIGGLIIHVYMGVFMVPGSVKAMTIGYVSRGWAMLHAPLWYKKVANGRTVK